MSWLFVPDLSISVTADPLGKIPVDLSQFYRECSEKEKLCSLGENVLFISEVRRMVRLLHADRKTTVK